MRICLWSAMLFAAAALMTLATVPVQSAKLGSYFEHTLFTQDREPAEAYKDHVLLMLHGFKSAMPNHDLRVMHRAFADGYTVAGFNYDYTDPAANVTEFEDLFARFLDGRRVTVIGTSLGGFWADFVVNSFDVDGAILVNPSVKPVETMRRNLGENFSRKRQEHFTVTEDHMKAYADLDVPARPGARRLVLLTKDDAILDYREAVEAFSGAAGTRVVVFEEGGHNLELERPDVMAIIQDFIAQGAAKGSN